MSPADDSWEIRNAEFDVDDRDRFLSELRRIARDAGATIVCFNADNLAGRRHAESAIRHALRSWNTGSAVANSFEMEALLFASGNRQCSVASSFGVHSGHNHAYICCCPAVAGIWDALALMVQYAGEPGDHLSAERRARLKELFSVSDDEISAAGESSFTDLILERVALLAVYR
ncbi:MAG: KEOPS complex subunit Cgi121 [Methanoregula sp.]|nr:MAG: KEOPS complex subunit Cgi121 [Methanoregula sp.]